MPTSWKRLPYDHSCKHAARSPRTAADSCALPTRRDARLVGGSGPGEPPACGALHLSESRRAPAMHVPHTEHKRAGRCSALNPSDGRPCFSGTPAARFTVRTALPLPTPVFLSACVFSRLGATVQIFHKHWGMTSSAVAGVRPGGNPSFPCPGRVGERRGAGATGQRGGELPGQSPRVRFVSTDFLCVCTLHRCCS